jgi:CHAT domain-containing protein
MRRVEKFGAAMATSIFATWIATSVVAQTLVTPTDLEIEQTKKELELIAGKQLLVVASGPLTSLPLHALVTEKPAIAIPTSFEGYRNVAWLGKSQAITVLPSVTSLYALRAQSSKRQRAPEDYIGIGNPVLEGTPGECRAVKVPERCPAANAGGQIAMGDASRATIRGGKGRRNARRNLGQLYATGREAAALLEQVRIHVPAARHGLRAALRGRALRAGSV